MSFGFGFSGGRGPAGPGSETQSIAGAVPANKAIGSVVLVQSGRTTGNEAVDLLHIDLLATGESVTIDAIVQCWEEDTHARQGVWQLIGSGQRTTGGVSSRTSTAGGGGAGQVANTFASPGKPYVSVSDPASAVSPNVANRLAILGWGKTGVHILWMIQAHVLIGKVG